MTNDEQILALHAEGLAPATIAQKLRITPSTVYRALRKKGIKREHSATTTARQIRDEMAPQVKELIDQGVSPTQICVQLNLGYDTLKKIAEENGLTLPRGKTGRPSEKDQKWPRALELLQQGRSQTEICAEMNIRLGTLANWVRDEKFEYTRIDRTDHTANLGKTASERAQNGAAGGKAAAEGLTTVFCLYPPCDAPVARVRDASGRMSRDRYCTREHAYAARREGSGKTTTYVCQYAKCEHPEFVWWTNQPRKYCSRKHYQLSNRGVPEYGFEGQILKGGYEAAFVGLCSVRGIQFEFFDRSQCVEWTPGDWYGPDFKVDVRGTSVYVDTKGAEQNSPKWTRFRAERGRLVILRREGLDTLMRETSTATEALSALKVMSIEQETN